MSMDSQISDTLFSPTPKLSLFSLPHHTPDPPAENLTPPFQTPASVPFKWEEAPGKPRRSFCGSGDEVAVKPKAARCLELPPSKITNMPSPSSDFDGPEPSPGPFSSFHKVVKGDCKVTYTPSPSSVLDGPGSGPKVCKTNSFSFRKLLKGEGKITNTPSPRLGMVGSGLGPDVSKTMSFSFRKFLKGEDKMMDNSSPSLNLDRMNTCIGPGPIVAHTMSFRFPNAEENFVLKMVDKEKVNFSSLRWGSERGFEEEGEDNLDYSSPFGGLEENGTRLRKRTGFWANVYKNVKQAVPWKRRQDKRRKMNI